MDVGVRDNRDGTFSCQYTPKLGGKHQVQVSHPLGSATVIPHDGRENRVARGICSTRACAAGTAC